MSGLNASEFSASKWQSLALRADAFNILLLHGEISKDFSISSLRGKGIDYLALDLTNISYYERNCRALFDKILEFQAQGWDVPKVMGLFSGCPYRGQVDLDKLNGFYNTFYKDAKYDSVWYRRGEKNKPLIAIDMANEFKELSFELQNYFCFRNSR